MKYFYRPKGMKTAYFEEEKEFKRVIKNYLKVMENLKNENIETELTIGTIKDINMKRNIDEP